MRQHQILMLGLDLLNLSFAEERKKAVLLLLYLR
jgi:hypothetical protein